MEDIVLMDAIERYLDGTMPPAEVQHFEQLRRENADVDQLVVEHIFFLKQMGRYNDRRQLKAQLATIHENLVQEAGIQERPQPAGKLVTLWNRYKRTVAVAATIAGIISISAIGLVFSYTRKSSTNDAFVKLRQEFDKTRQKVTEIEDSLKQAKNVPIPSANFGGTGFLIDGKGILVTNEHVVGRRKNLYIFNERYGNLTAEVIKTDPANDIAIVRITDTAFKGIKVLPYSIRRQEPELGQNVFTLGFPRPELIYNEGYISSRSAHGVSNSEANFLLTLRVDAGNSGSPILNNRGEIVGVINAREKNPNGFAMGIKSKIVTDLMEELKKDKVLTGGASRSNIGNLNRAEQVKKLEDFVFMMEVE